MNERAEMMKAIRNFKNKVKEEKGYTDFLTIIEYMLDDYDEDEEMLPELFQSAVNDVLDFFYAED